MFLLFKSFVLRLFEALLSINTLRIKYRRYLYLEKTKQKIGLNLNRMKSIIADGPVYLK